MPPGDHREGVLSRPPGDHRKGVLSRPVSNSGFPRFTRRPCQGSPQPGFQALVQPSPRTVQLHLHGDVPATDNHLRQP